MITLKQLQDIMKFQLENFNDENEEISNDTIHNKVLNEDDGFDHVNSVRLYKDVIRFVLKKKGHSLKEWPDHWLNLSVTDLSIKII